METREQTLDHNVFCLVNLCGPLQLYLALYLLTSSRIAMADLVVQGNVDTTLAALPSTAPEPADNRTTPAKVALGRLLFFDPVLSATKDTACATCHHPEHGWADGRATPLGVHAQGLGPTRRLAKGVIFLPLRRNTPSLLNVAFNGLTLGKIHDPAHAPMFWDNRVESLETQALAPIRSREEMRGDICAEAGALRSMEQRLQAIVSYREQFQSVFHADVSATRVAQALAAFERTLIVTDTPFDRYMRGDASAMTAQQKQGMEAFQNAGCTQCHNGPMLSDFKLHAIGLTDSTTARREFRTPSLRNLKYTAPYMHHGGSPSLHEVLFFYDRLMDEVAETLDGGDATSSPPLDPLLKKLNLLPEDQESILAFLDALNGEYYDKSTPDSVPSGLPVAGVEPVK
jgi:cytochrome c peroxidase